MGSLPLDQTRGPMDLICLKVNQDGSRDEWIDRYVDMSRVDGERRSERRGRQSGRGMVII